MASAVFSDHSDTPAQFTVGPSRSAMKSAKTKGTPEAPAFHARLDNLSSDEEEYRQAGTKEVTLGLQLLASLIGDPVKKSGGTSSSGLPTASVTQPVATSARTIRTRANLSDLLRNGGAAEVDNSQLVNLMILQKLEEATKMAATKKRSDENSSSSDSDGDGDKNTRSASFSTYQRMRRPRPHLSVLTSE